MAAPNLTLAVEPTEAGKAVFLDLAPPKAGASGHAMIILRLRITNNTANDVVVNAIQFSFPGSAVATVDMEGVQFVLDPDGDVKPAEALGKIAPGQTATWSNGRVDLDPGEAKDMHDNMIYVVGSAPPKVHVHVFCNGFSQAATITSNLAKYSIPRPGSALLLPIAAGDLRSGEFLVAQSWHWANGGAGGTQIMAHDVSVQAVTNGAWSQLLPDKEGTNDSYRIWDKPIRAMADGEVESWEASMDDNATLGMPKPTPTPTSGNHFWIKHGDVMAVYCHLRKGTQPAALLVKGAKVSAGQVLGRIGNSGNSSNPHTHIELRRDRLQGVALGCPSTTAG